MSPTDDDMESAPEKAFARLLQRALALPDAPRPWIDAASQLLGMRARIDLQGLAARAIKRVKAELAFDSWTASPLTLGVRSASETSRQLLFSAQDRDIDVRIVPSGSRYTLAGQVLGRDELGVIELAPAGVDQLSRSTPLDALGEFRIEDVERGSYVLTVRLSDEEIVVSPLDIGRDETSPL